jgi:hypothetical protein
LLVLRSDVAGWLLDPHGDDPDPLPQHGQL